MSINQRELDIESGEELDRHAAYRLVALNTHVELYYGERKLSPGFASTILAAASKCTTPPVEHPCQTGNACECAGSCR